MSFNLCTIINKIKKTIACTDMQFSILLFHKNIMHFLLRVKWQSLSLDYQFLMLILLNPYMFIKVMWSVHDNKWLGSQ